MRFRYRPNMDKGSEGGRLRTQKGSATVLDRRIKSGYFSRRPDMLSAAKLSGSKPAGRTDCKSVFRSYWSAKTGVAVMSEASKEKPWPPPEFCSAFKSAATLWAVLAE